MTQVGRVGSDELREPFRLAVTILRNPVILAAVPLYAGSFVAWTIILSRMQLSVAYPTLAMLYLIIPVASWLFLNESVAALHRVGMVLIVLGVLVVLWAGLA
jgi:drug/metabolite transporter (DMT)-like permease